MLSMEQSDCRSTRANLLKAAIWRPAIRLDSLINKGIHNVMLSTLQAVTSLRFNFNDNKLAFLTTGKVRPSLSIDCPSLLDEQVKKLALRVVLRILRQVALGFVLILHDTKYTIKGRRNATILSPYPYPHNRGMCCIP